MKWLTGFGWLKFLIRLISLIGFFGFVALFLFSYIGSCVIGGKNPPPVSEAPWVVQTSSRVYYGKEYRIINGAPALVGYWTLDGDGKYRFYKGTIPFPEREFGRVAIIRRTE